MTNDTPAPSASVSIPTPADKGTRLRSDDLGSIPAPLPRKYLAMYRAALGEGDVRAVRVRDTFALPGSTARSGGKMLTLYEEVIRDSAEFRAWHEAAVRALTRQDEE